MSTTTHKLRVVEARRIKHPALDKVEKHYLLVRAKDMPTGIRTDANARDPEGLNRRIYRDVQESLFGRGGTEPGTFDLLNKGIVCLADSVQRLGDDHTYEITIKEGQGIVDGAHTYKIICDAQGKPDLPDDQCVEFQIRTGVEPRLISDIARGLNTGIQVRPHSLDNLKGNYDWIKRELEGTSYYDKIEWRESDVGDYDVRDLISVMESLNVFDFPNDSAVHPIAAYEKWSTPAKKFSDDANQAKGDLSKSKYYRLRPILREALVLFDTIRHDFYEIHNEEKMGSAGKLDIVEAATGNRMFDFPFAGLPQSKYRLTKGALYPIFAAFRNVVTTDANGNACWKGGFTEVLKLWKRSATELIRQTRQSVVDIGRKPDQIGKNRGHWDKMHQTLELIILREELKKRGNGKK
jgi:hypothetical protein